MAYTDIGAIQEGSGRDIGAIESEDGAAPAERDAVPLVNGGLVMAGLVDGGLVE